MKAWADKQAAEEELDYDAWAAKQEHGPEYAYYVSVQDCEQAQFGRVEGTVMIRSKILEREGGWAQLNNRMANFRKPQIRASSSDSVIQTSWC